MSKLVKELITRDLTERYADADNAVWIELAGIDGLTTNAFRRDLRGREMRLEIVKTSLLRRAVKGRALAPLADKLEGPAALVTGGDSPIDVAKLLEEWAPKVPKDATFRIRGAVLDGEYLDEKSAQDLAKMPTKADMQGRIVRIILTPGGNVVAAALGPGAAIAGILMTIADKLEKGEAIAAAG